MVKALILYEDLETGLRAKDSLDRLSRQLERDESLSTELYRLDLLREPLGREMVAIEAAARDIAILSLHGKDGSSITVEPASQPPPMIRFRRRTSGSTATVRVTV